MTDTIVKKANAQPGLARVFTTFSANTPQLYLDIDREAAKQMGVTLADINNTLNANMGSMYVNQFNEFGRVWQVNIQAEGSFRKSARGEPQARSRVRNREGQPVHSGARAPGASCQWAGLRHAALQRHEFGSHQRRAAPPGSSSGQAISVMEKLCQENLPAGMSYKWATISYQQVTAGNTGIYIFAFAVLLVFLVLAALASRAGPCPWGLSWSCPCACSLRSPAWCGSRTCPSTFSVRSASWC